MRIQKHQCGTGIMRNWGKKKTRNKRIFHAKNKMMGPNGSQHTASNGRKGKEKFNLQGPLPSLLCEGRGGKV